MKQYLYLAIALCCSLPLAAQNITHGPITGGVTPNSARIGLMTDAAATVTIQIDTASSLATPRLVTGATSAPNGNMAMIDIDSLQPNTKYYYKATTGTATSDLYSFMTYPCQGQSLQYVFTFGSCMNENRTDDAVFDEMTSHNPRFFLQVGDWGYPDGTDNWPNDHDYFPADYARVIQSYRNKYNYTYQKQFLKNVPVDYIWDDHDYANDNSSRYTTSQRDFGFNTVMVEDSFPPGTRRNSIMGYYNMFPGYAPVDSSEGIFHKFRFGNTEFYMLDDRAARSPTTESLKKVNGQWEFNPPPGHSIIGPVQRQWLLDQLRSSTATWKFVISATAFNKTYRDAIDGLLNLPSLAGLPLAASLADCWSGFPMDQDSLINAVNNANIDGVVMLSGDTHTAAMDNGQAGGLPEVMAGALSQSNSTLYTTVPLLAYGLTWNEGGQGINGNTNVNDAFGKITVYGDSLLKLELIDENGTVFADQLIRSCSSQSGLTLEADSVTQILCGGYNTGRIELATTGGTAPYNYTLDGETYQLSPVFDSLVAGIFHPAVKDAAGCTRELCITITEPAVFKADTLITNVTCNGENNGAINLNVQGGITPYSISWLDGDTAAIRDSLTAGTYAVTLTDGNGCVLNLQPEVRQPLPLNVVFNNTPTRCNGENNGIAVATPAGGTAPYTYNWSNSSTQAAQNTLAAGEYVLTLTDANSCVYSDTATVTEPAALSVTTTTLPDNGSGTGIITLTPIGGTPAYSYLWFDNSTNATISGLFQGSYPVQVTDRYGCVLDTVINVPFGVGIEQIAESLFKIYPNPVKDELKVEMNLKTASNITIELFDMRGRKMVNENLGQVKTITKNLNVSSYPSGNYFVKISGDTFQKFYTISVSH